MSDTVTKDDAGGDAPIPPQQPAPSSAPRRGPPHAAPAGGIATITLQQPALSSALRRDLLDVVRAVAADESVRAVLLTGSGRAFCVGQDLAEHVESLRGNAATSLSVVEDEYNPLILALAAL